MQLVKKIPKTYIILVLRRNGSHLSTYLYVCAVKKLITSTYPLLNTQGENVTISYIPVEISIWAFSTNTDETDNITQNHQNMKYIHHADDQKLEEWISIFL